MLEFFDPVVPIEGNGIAFEPILELGDAGFAGGGLKEAIARDGGGVPGEDEVPIQVGGLGEVVIDLDGPPALGQDEAMPASVITVDPPALSGGNSSAWMADPSEPVLDFGFRVVGPRLSGGPVYKSLQDGQEIVVTAWLLDGGGHTFRGFDGPHQNGYDNPTLEPGGGGGGSYEMPVQIANETLCVNENARPSGASLQDINNAALTAATMIEAKQGIYDEEHVEWGSFIFVLNGQVGFTEPYTHNLEDRIPIYPSDLNAVPDGAIIVGFVHNHTALGINQGQDQRLASPADRAVRSALANWATGDGAARNISVDVNMLLYIHAPQGVGPQDANRTRVYDRTDGDELECALQGVQT